MGFNPFKMISSFLDPGSAYEDASNQVRQSWEQAQELQKPFREHGLEQYPNLLEFINRLKDPASLQNEWASKYEISPYAQRLNQLNQQQGLDAASSMGLMGSSGALGNIQQMAGDVTSKDRQNFLNDLMQKYMAGIGLSSGIYNTGAGTATNLGTQGIGVGRDLSGLAYGQRAAPGELFGKLLGMGLGMAGMPGGGGMGGMGGGGFVNSSNMFNR